MHTPELQEAPPYPIGRSFLWRNVKRSIVIKGRKTSVFLEEEFWLALQRIARSRSISLNQLAEDVSESAGGNLSSALRVYALQFYERLSGIK